MNRLITSTIVGLVSGILGGAFGLGGSFIMLPGLIFFHIVPNFKIAVGTVLFSLLPPLSILAVIEYGKRGEIDYLVGIILCIAYLISAYFGARINAMCSDKVLKYGSALTFLIIAMYFFYDAYITK